jgi:antibiotic biosynthesis monooxygenase (ABM) superfamily enzyme
MIYLTQLVYVHAGQEDVFHQFEDIAIPLIAKHRGQLMLRLRPNAESVIANNVEVPYEVHIVRFDNEDDLASFAQDDERQRFLHLKNQSIRSSLLVKGTAS